MAKDIAAITISDELSGEVATAILTKQKQMNRDPHELLAIVRMVHVTLQDLSIRARDRRLERIGPRGQRDTSC